MSISSALGKVNADRMRDKSLTFGYGIFSNIGIPKSVQWVAEQCIWNQNSESVRIVAKRDT